MLVLSMAWMMLRTLSWMTVVGPMPRGPTAEMTASAPVMAGTIKAGSMTSAERIRSPQPAAAPPARTATRQTAPAYPVLAAANQDHLLPRAAAAGRRGRTAQEPPVTTGKPPPTRRSDPGHPPGRYGRGTIEAGDGLRLLLRGA